MEYSNSRWKYYYYSIIIISFIIGIMVIINYILDGTHSGYNSIITVSGNNVSTPSHDVTGNLYMDQTLDTPVHSDSLELGHTYYLVVENIGQLPTTYYITPEGTTFSDLLMFMDITVNDYDVSSEVSYNYSNMIYTQVRDNRKLVISSQLDPGQRDIFEVTYDYNEFYDTYVNNEIYKDYFQSQTLFFKLFIQATLPQGYIPEQEVNEDLGFMNKSAAYSSLQSDYFRGEIDSKGIVSDDYSSPDDFIDPSTLEEIENGEQLEGEEIKPDEQEGNEEVNSDDQLEGNEITNENKENSDNLPTEDTSSENPSDPTSVVELPQEITNTENDSSNSDISTGPSSEESNNQNDSKTEVESQINSTDLKHIEINDNLAVQ